MVRFVYLILQGQKLVVFLKIAHGYSELVLSTGELQRRSPHCVTEWTHRMSPGKTENSQNHERSRSAPTLNKIGVKTLKLMFSYKEGVKQN